MRRYQDPFEALIAETVCEFAEEMESPQEKDFEQRIPLDIPLDVRYILSNESNNN
jgi:hypothetical protein